MGGGEDVADRLFFEKRGKKEGFRCIAGIDEAGRGPLAGPVVAAACLFAKPFFLAGVDDSKKLSPAKRKGLYEALTASPEVVWGVGIVDPETIDRVNIYQATILAMQEAVRNLRIAPDLLLVDGMELKGMKAPSWKIIKGDALSFTIGCASILAKETRDRMMCQKYHPQWPEYGFDQHKGYGTPQHLEALEKYGPCPGHRKTFEPIKSMAGITCGV